MHTNHQGGLWCRVAFSLLLLTSFTSHAQLIWTVGLHDNGWPCNALTPCDGGGAKATFVAETGGINPLPGVPDSPEVDRQADNDYYFAGIYTNVIASITARQEYGGYTADGVDTNNDEAVERDFAAG